MTFRDKEYARFLIKVIEDPATDPTRIVAALADRKPYEHFPINANSGSTIKIALWILRLLPERLDFILEELYLT